jgi:cytidine deaminase
MDRMNPLREAAEVARSRAYAPYSGFRVGAALETSAGTIVAGCNVENASYGLTICAERSALAAAVAAGHTAFRRLALVSDAEVPISPCGTCRQVLHEFGSDLVVESYAGDRVSRWTVAELLPAAFGRDHLS